MYYDGRLRQRGGGGLGGIFRVLARTILPSVLHIGKKFIRRKAASLAPKAIDAGIGIAQDMLAKKTFKQAVQQRGKRLISDAINISTANTKRQKTIRPRTGNKSRARVQKRKKKNPRNRDIFD